jgi:hypothetical protein
LRRPQAPPPEALPLDSIIRSRWPYRLRAAFRTAERKMFGRNSGESAAWFYYGDNYCGNSPVCFHNDKNGQGNNGRACGQQKQQTKRNKNVMPIANVQEEGGWIKVYDENSKKISQMSGSGVEILGVGSDFFVTEIGGWIKTFDQNCKKIAQMSSTNIAVISAAGQTFTTKEGNWTKIYDRNCKKISQR